MKRKHTYSILTIAALAVAIAVVLNTRTAQTDAGATQTQASQLVNAPQGNQTRVTQAAASQQLADCSAVSPFAKADTDCKPVSNHAASDTAPADSGQTAGSNTSPDRPEFKNVHLVGNLGDGVVGKLLKTTDRNLSGTTPQKPDSVLVDTSAMPDGEATAAIRQALYSGQYVIVDGSDSAESSAKINKIMLDMNLISLEGVTAYSVVKGTGGNGEEAFYVTPLQSLTDKEGKRAFDQMHSFLGIDKE